MDDASFHSPKRQRVEGPAGEGGEGGEGGGRGGGRGPDGGEPSLPLSLLPPHWAAEVAKDPTAFAEKLKQLSELAASLEDKSGSEERPPAAALSGEAAASSAAAPLSAAASSGGAAKLEAAKPSSDRAAADTDMEGGMSSDHIAQPETSDGSGGSHGSDDSQRSLLTSVDQLLQLVPKLREVQAKDVESLSAKVKSLEEELEAQQGDAELKATALVMAEEMKVSPFCCSASSSQLLSVIVPSNLAARISNLLPGAFHMFHLLFPDIPPRANGPLPAHVLLALHIRLAVCATQNQLPKLPRNGGVCVHSAGAEKICT